MQARLEFRRHIARGNERTAPTQGFAIDTRDQTVDVQPRHFDGLLDDLHADLSPRAKPLHDRLPGVAQIDQALLQPANPALQELTLILNLAVTIDLLRQRSLQSSGLVCVLAMTMVLLFLTFMFVFMMVIAIGVGPVGSAEHRVARCSYRVSRSTRDEV